MADQRSTFETEYEIYGGVVKGETDFRWLIAFDEDKDTRVIEFFETHRQEKWMNFAYALHEHEGILFLGVPFDYETLEWDFDFRFPREAEVPDDYWTVELERLTEDQRRVILGLCGLDTDPVRAQAATTTGRVVYYEYINSPEWKQKSDEAKHRAGYRCQVCNHGGTLNTHHRTYERLGHELPQDLIVLCRSCHEIFHREGKLAK